MVLIISLKESQKRREILIKKLNEIDVEFMFINAFDLRYINEEAKIDLLRKKIITYSVWRNLSCAEIGCALSHKKAYEYIVNNNLDGAVILEDDVILNDNFKEFIDTVIFKKNINNKIIILGGQEGTLGEKRLYFSKRSTTSVGEFVIKKSFYSNDRIKRACAYYITKSGALQLLEVTKTITCEADSWNEICKLNNNLSIWMLFPNVASHPRIIIGQSTIEPFRKSEIFNGKSSTKIRSYIADFVRKVGSSFL